MWLFLFFLWIILNGRITLELVIFGILIASAVCFVADRMLGYSYKTDLRILRNLPLFLLYILVLLWAVIQSAFTMAAMVYQAEEPDPVIVEFHSGLKTQLQNVLLANSITLTPGTITLFQEGDHFVIHCLKEDFAEGLDTSVFVRLLQKLH